MLMRGERGGPKIAGGVRVVADRTAGGLVRVVDVCGRLRHAGVTTCVAGDVITRVVIMVISRVAGYGQAGRDQ
ncbi:MAG: hypothetical protein C4344_03685, partial [Acidimicrobiia bacterium]